MSHEIQSVPSNHPHEHESQAISNKVPQNRFLRDLLSVQVREHYREERRKADEEIRKFNEERRKYREIYLPLYDASIRCDWKAAKDILDKNPEMNLLRRSITENGETALHIAASAKGPKKLVDEFVKNMVGKMQKGDLERVNRKRSTALYLAATAGNIETVKIMMEKNSTLDTIPGGEGHMMPLYAALLFGNKDVAKYLFECSKNLSKHGWNDENRSSLLVKCVESDMFDIALNIVTRYPSVGRTSIILQLLARKPEAFHEKKSSNISEYNIIRRTIKWGNKHPYLCINISFHSRRALFRFFCTTK